MICLYFPTVNRPSRWASRPGIVGLAACHCSMNFDLHGYEVVLFSPTLEVLAYGAWESESLASWKVLLGKHSVSQTLGGVSRSEAAKSAFCCRRECHGFSRKTAFSHSVPCVLRCFPFLWACSPTHGINGRKGVKLKKKKIHMHMWRKPERHLSEDVNSS